MKYHLGAEVIDKITDSLAIHSMVKLGEHGDITPEVAKKILKAAL